MLARQHRDLNLVLFVVFFPKFMFFSMSATFLKMTSAGGGSLKRTLEGGRAERERSLGLCEKRVGIEGLWAEAHWALFRMICRYGLPPGKQSGRILNADENGIQRSRPLSLWGPQKLR